MHCREVLPVRFMPLTGRHSAYRVLSGLDRNRLLECTYTRQLFSERRFVRD